MNDLPTQDEKNAEQFLMAARHFAYQRVVNGCQFTYAGEMRYTLKLSQQIFDRKCAEAFNEAMLREAT